MHDDQRGSFNIETISFQLGMINCFVEMVACGVKKLALSPPLSPEDYAIIGPLSDKIVSGFGLFSYLEKALLTTKLQSVEFTRGKWSILYYADEKILQKYFGLKNKKKQLEGSGTYNIQAQQDISRDFMRLLSYPEKTIAAILNQSAPESPFMLIEDKK